MYSVTLHNYYNTPKYKPVSVAFHSGHLMFAHLMYAHLMYVHLMYAHLMYVHLMYAHTS